MSLIASDPRYQRALQQARARAHHGNAPRSEQISAEYANRQTRTNLAFQQLGLRKMTHRRVLRGNEIAAEEARFNRSMAQQRANEALRQLQRQETATHRRIDDLREDRRTFRASNIMGLGTSMYAQHEANRRANLLNQQAEEQRTFNRGILSALNRRT
jgi:hypothetical protein